MAVVLPGHVLAEEMRDRLVNFGRLNSAEQIRNYDLWLEIGHYLASLLDARADAIKSDK